MRRVIMMDGAFGNKVKFVLKDDYNGFGIYQEKCPSGYFVSQSYLITDGVDTIIIPSYNNCCVEELFDAIDCYKDSGKYEFRVMVNDTNIYTVHPNGKRII